MYGKKHTDETKKKISNSLLNNPTIKGRLAIVKVKNFHAKLKRKYR